MVNHAIFDLVCPLTWVEVNQIERNGKTSNSHFSYLVQICQGADREDPSMVSLNLWELDEMIANLTNAKEKIVSLTKEIK